MGPPPGFGDIHGPAKGVFGRGYNWGFLKLNVRSKTENGIDVSANMNSNRDSGNISGDLQTKYKWPDYGICLTEKWNTANMLNTKVDIDDLIEGMELSINSSFSPSTGEKSGTLEASYTQEFFNAAVELDFPDIVPPELTASACIGSDEGVSGGTEVGFDSAGMNLTKCSFGARYGTSDFGLSAAVNTSFEEESSDQEYFGFLYQKVNPELDAAASIQYKKASGAVNFSLGCQYKLDDLSSLRAKLNNAGHIGLGYTQQLREGLKATMSTLIDSKNLNNGGHKVGIGFEFAL